MSEFKGDLRKGTRARNYIAGLTTGYVFMFVNVLVGLWLTPFTLKFLDREQYAIFTMSSDVLLWLTLLDLGISAGLRVRAAQLMGRPDQEKLNCLASTAFYAQNFVALAVLVVGSALSIGFPRFFNIRPDLQYDAMMLMVLMVVGAAASIAMQTFSALLVAKQQIHVDNFIGMLNIVLRTALTIVLLNAGWGLYSLVAANLAAKGVSLGLAVVRTFRLLPGLQIKYRLASWETMRSLGNLGIWFSLGSLAGLAIGSLDRLVTAKVVSVDMVTTLTLTGRMYALSGGLIAQITETARPMLGQMLGANKMADALRSYRHLFAMSTGAAVVAAASMWAGNGSFVVRWVGPANYGGLWVDLALAFNVILNYWVLPNRAILSANLTVRSQTLGRMVEGAFNLVLSIILGRIYGVLGVIVATGIAGLCTSMWYLPLLTARMFQRPFARFLWEDAAPTLALLGCMAVIAPAARHLAMNIGGYEGAATGVFLTGACGNVLVWFIVLDKPMRARIMAVLGQMTQRARAQLNGTSQ
jgi:O-antigen/teichoic acid export membrane protein